MEKKKEPKNYNSYRYHKLTVNKYLSEKVKKITVTYTNQEFDQRIRPEIEKSGLPMASYIKLAVDEKIERDNKNIS